MGRPKGAEQGIVVSIYLSPAKLKHLTRDGLKPSRAIRRLIDDDMASESTQEPDRPVDAKPGPGTGLSGSRCKRD